ncbi:MAG: TonB-dependent receptor [Pseudomonadota bacterium]
MKAINTISSSLKVGVSAAALCGLAVASGPAAAQSGERSATDLSLEQITVTARKIEEGLQDAPVSVTAATGDGLALRDIQNITGISNLAPNVNFGLGGGSGSQSQANLFIRGVGQNDFTLVADPGVGLYVDGVYYARAIGSTLDLFDIERVQALRGPQGTLFGRNSVGGAITIDTNDPTDEFGGKMRLIVGDDERIEAYASINAPVTDTFSVLISALARRREGTVFDASGRELGNDSVQGGRIKTLWTPLDNFEVTFSADYVNENEGGLPEVPLVRAADGSVSDSEQVFFRSPVLDTQGPNDNTLDSFGFALTAEYGLSDSLEVKSITAYREIDATFNRNPPGGSNFSSQDDFEQSQISQEIQLIGTTELLDFVVGGFYFSEDGANPTTIDIPAAPVFPRFVGVTDISNRSLAVFGELTIPLTERFRVIGGVRYTDEEKDASFTSASIPGVTRNTAPGDPVVEAIGFENPQTLNFSEVTYRGVLQYDVFDTTTVYASWSTGFKSGGFNQRLVGFAPGQFTEPDTFEPETVRTAEVGFKFENSILRFNASGFYSDYEDVQISGAPPGAIATETFNGAEAEIYGFEVEGTFTPTSSLLFDFSAGVIEAEYIDVQGTGTEITEDDEFVRTPPFTVSFGANYIYDIGAYGSLRARTDVFVSGEVFFEPQNVIGTNEDGYADVGASLSWINPNEDWIVTAGVNNITDARYLISADANAALAYDIGAFARPRNWYVTLQKTF